MSKIEITDPSKFKEIMTEENDSSVMMEDIEEENLFKKSEETHDQTNSDEGEDFDEEDSDGWKQGKFSRNEQDKIHIGRYMTFKPDKKGIPKIFIGPDCNVVLKFRAF